MMYAEESLRGYPMAWGWANRALLDTPNNPVIGLQEEAKAFVCLKCKKFTDVLRAKDRAIAKSGHKAIAWPLYAFALEPRGVMHRNGVYDRTLFEMVEVGPEHVFAPLKPLFPLVLKVARSTFVASTVDAVRVVLLCAKEQEAWCDSLLTIGQGELVARNTSSGSMKAIFESVQQIGNVQKGKRTQRK